MSVQEARRAGFESKFSIPEDVQWDEESNRYLDDRWREDGGGEYQAQWEGWNAALDSVVVELPAIEEHIIDGWFVDVMAADEVQEAIEAAGIRVEVKS